MLSYHAKLFCTSYKTKPLNNLCAYKSIKYMNTKTDKIHQLITHVWNESNFKTISDIICSNYTIYQQNHDPWNGQTLDSRLFEQRISYYRDCFPDLKIYLQDCIEAAEHVTTTWILTGTHSGRSFQGIPANGQPIKYTGITLYFFQQGLVRGHWQEEDNLTLYNQLGVI